jgi:hypothetical protein
VGTEFPHDAVECGLALRVLIVVDPCTRDCLCGKFVEIRLTLFPNSHPNVVLVKIASRKAQN